MSNVMDFAGFTLTRLGPEPWGCRLTRAREAAGLTVRDVDRMTGSYVTKSALSRLEDMVAVPEKIADRRRALVALLLYRVDPTDFGLGPEDVPPLIDINAVVQANEAFLCFSCGPGGQHVDDMLATHVLPLAA
jgi:hypothetical protein